jgi:hypothetical protein
MLVYGHLPFLSLNPLIFIRNKPRVISSEGISANEKNPVGNHTQLDQSAELAEGRRDLKAVKTL